MASIGQNPEGFDEMIADQVKGTVPYIKAEDCRSSFIYIDTRDHNEFEVSHLKNAILVDYESKDLSALDTILKDTPLVLYCSIGYRSEIIGELLLKKGFTNVSNLYGGMFNWANNDFPIVNNNNETTTKIHGYSETWSKWINPKLEIIKEKRMSDFLNTFTGAMQGHWNWMIKEFTFQVDGAWYQNYFLWLTFISLVVFGLEVIRPWRKNQAVIRKDFWLDAFYMYFNFYIFSLFITGFYAVMWSIMQSFGFDDQSFALLSKDSLPPLVMLLVFFILNDFVQWFTHFLLHKFPLLWQFHQVHHSVKEMGFAAHLRYHWMENIFYKPLKTLVVMVLLGAEPSQAFIVHFISITIGHLNHANIDLNYGFLKYVFNNPRMHIWHHVKELPKDRQNGINFGISLSIWDYIFKTAYIPYDGRDIELGFENDEIFPKTFFGQLIYPLKK